MLKEFKEFALKGNVMDMAVGVVIGAAFGKIVASLVNDIIMPIVGALAGGVDFTQLKIVLNEDAAINYGIFIQTAVDFVIIAFAIFLAVKAVNRLHRGIDGKGAEEEAAEETPPAPTEAELLAEIRDLLKKETSGHI